MKTPSFHHFDTYIRNVRPPRTTFAARLAGLQACHEQVMHHADVTGVVAGGVMALVPFLGLAWMFVAL